MAMGTKANEQAGLFVTYKDVPRSAGHPFYDALEAILREHGFDRFVEAHGRRPTAGEALRAEQSLTAIRTAGRGWFDAVATSYGARVSGVDCIAVMLLDVLSKLDELKICEAYEIDGERTTDLPSQIQDLERAKPVYRTVPGWKKDITGVRRMEDFPKEARQYIDTVSELVERPVEFVSIGPDRDQTVIL